MAFQVTKELAFRNVFGMGCRFSTRLTMKAQQVRTTFTLVFDNNLKSLSESFGVPFRYLASGAEVWAGSQGFWDFKVRQ